MVRFTWFLLRVVALINPRIKQFVKGRYVVFEILREKLTVQDKTIWMHVASLGEFEQGLPILERLRKNYPSHKIVTTFFSPSGYEVKKNTQVSDIVTYLPMDTPKNVHYFLRLVRPELALFVKYEIWPNYLRYLSKMGVPTLLISALFTEKKIYFKRYGAFMRKALQKFHHIFVQEEHSKQLLESIGFGNVTVGGDTRFDRVSQIREQDNRLDFIESFREGKICFVGGSTWPDDEHLIVDYINSNLTDLKYVLAPHNINQEHIQSLKKSIKKRVFLYSELDKAEPREFDVLVVDTVGLLTKIYSYADIAYVGGGFGTGLHNTLEPAVFGVPVVIGPEYQAFHEARELVELGGIQVIKDKEGFCRVLTRFANEPEYRKHVGQINATYVQDKKGASIQIMDYIRTLL